MQKKWAHLFATIRNVHLIFIDKGLRKQIAWSIPIPEMPVLIVLSPWVGFPDEAIFAVFSHRRAMAAPVPGCC
ncbi:MAG: hypothetical protein JJU21_14965 [Salinarimonas sp.]|nr:hypothetical protein [Salinarimonas sp.]